MARQPELTGFQHPRFASSLEGVPRWLVHSGCWALLRPIDTETDAVGAAPTLVCDDIRALALDLDELAEAGAVSFTTMLYGEDVEPSGLEVVGPPRAHYFSHPREPWRKHARRNARAAAGLVSVGLGDESSADDFVRLYEHLRRLRAIHTDFALSPAAIRQQVAVPGAVVFLAHHRTETVAAQLWYVHDRLAVYQLAAADDTGYRTMASYALMHFAFGYFDELGIELLDLGRTPPDGTGLVWFKTGLGAWKQDSFCCGRILRYDLYDKLVRDHGQHDWFPAYRRPLEAVA